MQTHVEFKSTNRYLPHVSRVKISKQASTTFVELTSANFQAPYFTRDRKTLRDKQESILAAIFLIHVLIWPGCSHSVFGLT